MRKTFRAVTLLVAVLLAVPAAGQSTYVAGSVDADISRFSRFEVAGVETGGLTGGEAVSAGCRLDRSACISLSASTNSRSAFTSSSSPSAVGLQQAAV